VKLRIGYDCCMELYHPNVFDMSIPYLNEALMKELGKRIPAGYVTKPGQIAGAALFLASRLSDYVIGHVPAVDGALSSNITIKSEAGSVQYT